MNRKPDIKARMTLTGRKVVYSGYRPVHMIGNDLTSRIQEYFNTEKLTKGNTVDGFITFITPEYYHYSLKCGIKFYFQEGSKIMEYAEI